MLIPSPVSLIAVPLVNMQNVQLKTIWGTGLFKPNLKMHVAILLENNNLKHFCPCNA